MSPPRQKPGRSRQDFVTPDVFIAAVKRRLGIESFAFDFAADYVNTKAPRFWNEAADALSFKPTEWRAQLGDGWGWLNPPFARIEPWAQYCAAVRRRGGSIAFLVPAGVGANWFRDHVQHGRALVLLLNGRIAFMPDKPTWGYPKDCILALYSPRVRAGYKVWNWRG